MIKTTTKKILTYFQKQPLTRLIHGSILTIAIMLVVVVGHYWASYENKRFKKELNQTREELLDYQKQLVRREVNRTINYIYYMRSLSRERMMDDLTGRVNTAWDIANNIYLENKGSKSDREIKKMIKDALRVYRSGNLNDNVFIYTLDGTSVLIPNNKSWEGVSGLNLRDTLGNYMVKREIELMKELDKGFITYFRKDGMNNTDSSVYRYTYIKKFTPYSWYLGSKEYQQDFEEILKEDVLNRISKIRFDADGYIFVQGMNNEPILSNGTNIRNEKINFTAVSESERQKITDTALAGGGFVGYKINRVSNTKSELKIAFVQPIKEWNWIIGAGFYTQDVDEIIALRTKELSAQRQQTITIIIISLFIILTIGYLLTKLLVNRIKRGFDKFDNFFKDASTDYKLINDEALVSPEFISLAKSANKMLTDLSLTRSALEKEHSLLLSVMNSIPDMVFFKDTESRYIGCNDAFLKFLGISETELIGKTDFELFPAESAEFYFQNDQKILKDGIPLKNEEWSTLPNGNHCLFETVKALCYDRSGKVLGIICISRDMTEREIIQKKYIQAKEKAEESDRLKTAFLANMSHEIRTPMNSIVGFSNLIAEGGLTDEEQKEYVGHIDTAINNLLNIINDIIDIAKIEAGQLSIKPDYISIHHLMDNVSLAANEYKRKLNRNDVILSFICDEKLKDCKVLADPFRLNQVITNLVNNALKFTIKGTVEVSCELSLNEIYFFVKDTGMGISEEDQQQLFKRFRQVGQSNGYKMGGTGLGLAISKHIVELMNGSISVTSTPGTGSLFTFKIPYYPFESVIDKPSLVSVNWKEKTVLVLEKEDASFNYLKAVFSSTGAKVLRASDLESTKQLLLENKKINLIYSDMEALEQTAEKFINTARSIAFDVPIIAQISSKQEVELNNLAFDTFIAKPVQYHLLLQVLAPYMRN